MKLLVLGQPGGKWQRWISNEDLQIIKKQNKTQTCFPHFTMSFVLLTLELSSHRKRSLPLGRLFIR